MKKLFYLTFVALLSLMGIEAQAANTLTLPYTGSESLFRNYTTLGKNCKMESVDSSNGEIGSTKKGGSFTVTINNHVEQAYNISFLAGNSDETASWNITVVNSSSTSYLNQTFSNNKSSGGWVPTESKSFTTSVMPAGTYTLKMECTAASPTYGGNFKDLKITPVLKDAAEYDQCPGTIQFQNGSFYGNIKNEVNNGKIGSIKNGGIAYHDFYCTTQANYFLCMGIAHWGDGNMKIDVIDLATCTIENSQTVALTSDMKSFAIQKFLINDLSVGAKTLRLSFSGAGSSGYGYIIDYKNVSMETAVVPTYTFAVSNDNTAAGSVTPTPEGAEFDEGTDITLTATRNFGYQFVAWVDGEGNTVSTANPYSFKLSENTSLKATWKTIETYPLNVTIKGGANDYMVGVSPAGNIIDGVNWYETGTVVTLSAIENNILDFYIWEDNSNELTRTITMDSEKNIVAKYFCKDYIVGWDFYKRDPRSQRVADYASDSSNKGLLSLRKEDGTINSWLGRGTDEGEPYLGGNARPWKNLTEKYYFEISFSTKGYKDITIENKMGKDYNSYNIFNVEYSTDGTTYTKCGQVDIPTTTWVNTTIALPTEAENKETVWVRWMPDFTSGISGAESDLDGIKWGATFVLATLTDEMAPQKEYSLPIDNAGNVSVNGTVRVAFNEPVFAESTVNATLNGEAITMEITGKTLNYEYSGLQNNTTYTLCIPAGAVKDRAGNASEAVSLTFTTMERTQPTTRLYDAVVAADGTGNYTTVQAAIDAAPENLTSSWLIFIKAGTYNEHVNIPKTKPYIHLIGESKEKVSISDNRLSGGENAVHTSIGATVVAESDNLFFEGISFVNSYGVEKKDGPQALALNTMGDRLVFNKCGMYSYQDTWITTSTSNNRCYAKQCFIEGAVDYIYNSGNYYFDECTQNIVRKDGGFIVAPSHAADVEWGYVFVNNTITAPGIPSETSVWLGRPWHNSPKTVWINTKAEVTLYPEGWAEHMGGLPALWAEYNTMDGDGNVVDLSKRRTKYYKEVDGVKVWSDEVQAVLSANEATQYTIENVLGGDDNWQPEVMCEPCAAPAPIVVGTTMTWAPVPYAICYVITKDDKVVGFTTERSYAVEEGATYKVQAANEFGGLSEAGTAVEAKTYTLTTADTDLYGLYLPYEVALPTDVRAFTGKLNEAETELRLTEIKDVIPAEEAVVVKSKAAGSHEFVQSTTGAAKSIDNSLKGVETQTDVEVLTPEDKTLLTLGMTDGVIGFRQPKNNYVGANKVYLLVNKMSSAKLTIRYPEDDTTGITEVSTTNSKDIPTYNLAGQRVDESVKGLLIKNGKKVLVK